MLYSLISQVGDIDMIKDKERCHYEQAVIRFGNCDHKQRARLSTILQQLSDVAGLAYDAKGYTHEWLWEHGNVFLLSRFSLRFFRMPGVNEELTVETWEKGTKGPLFYRLFSIYDKRGKKIVDSESAWVLVNPQTRQIIRPKEFTGHFNLYPEKKVDTLPCEKINPKIDFQTQGTYIIRYADLDGNGHTNNAKYADIACNFIPIELFDEPVKDFRIQFKQEAKLYQELTIQTAIEGKHVYVRGMLGDIVSFECEFFF